LSIKATDDAIFQDLMKRMRRIEGQARGIQRLLEEGAECEDVVTQLSAMRGAISRVAVKVAACQLGKQMAQEIHNGGTGQAAVDDMVHVFMQIR